MVKGRERSWTEAREEAPSWIGKGVMEVISEVRRMRVARRRLEAEVVLAKE